MTENNAAPPAGGRKKKARKPKPVRVARIERLPAEAQPDTGRNPYPLMDGIIEQRHPHLFGLRIVLVWLYAVKPDRDDRLTLGWAKKATDLEREQVKDKGGDAHDFTVALNFDAWQRFGEKERAALMEHELLHCQVALDAEGEVKQDERGRTVCRMRGHDIEEFRAIVERYGLWKEDLEKFARSCLAAADQKGA